MGRYAQPLPPDHFRKFPFRAVTTPRGEAAVEADLQRFGKEVAIYKEWQRYRFLPMFRKLEEHITTIDPIWARHVLVDSQDWETFEDIARREFKLPGVLRMHLKECNLRLVVLLGKYWANYYRGLEKRQPRDVGSSPYATPDDWLAWTVENWFSAAYILCSPHNTSAI